MLSTGWFQERIQS